MAKSQLTVARVPRRTPTALERLLGKCEKVCAYLEHPDVLAINFGLSSQAAANSLRQSMDEVWALIGKVAKDKQQRDLRAKRDPDAECMHCERNALRDEALPSQSS